MLPSYITNKIIKRDKEMNQWEDLVVECPVPSPSDDIRDDVAPEDEVPEDRGVVILDFTI